MKIQGSLSKPGLRIPRQAAQNLKLSTKPSGARLRRAHSLWQQLALLPFHRRDAEGLPGSLKAHLPPHPRSCGAGLGFEGRQPDSTGWAQQILTKCWAHLGQSDRWGQELLSPQPSGTENSAVGGTDRVREATPLCFLNLPQSSSPCQPPSPGLARNSLPGV